MLLTGKTVVVTGAGGGLGAGIAAVCSREGANVVVADIRGQAADAVADSLPGDALAVHCDVGDDDAQSDLVQKAVAAFGRVDGLVNNAGINFANRSRNDAADWETSSVSTCAQSFLTQRSAGRCSRSPPVAAASSHRQRPRPCRKARAAPTRRQSRRRHDGQKLRPRNGPAQHSRQRDLPRPARYPDWQDLQDAAPSPEECLDFWRTNIPSGRVIAPEEIGELAAFLLSDRSASITGANIYADGGMTAQLISQEPYTSKPIEG